MNSDFSEYMNPPEIEFAKIKKGKFADCICCPKCGKKQFQVLNITKISNLIWTCESNKCKYEFQIEYDGLKCNEKDTAIN